MITFQILNKVLQTGDMSIITSNALTDDHFIDYPNEFNFIYNHYNKYGKCPDKETFLSKFPTFEFVTVGETDKYLIEGLGEEYLYYKAVPLVQKMAELLKGNAVDAVDYMMSEIKNLPMITGLGGVNIIKDAAIRLNEHQAKAETPDGGFIKSGFEEIDAITGGFCKGEELVILFARTGQGKSWILTAIGKNAWHNEYRVGYVSPEMGASKLGYRFDTLFKHYSNTALTRGYNVEGYADYIKGLANLETPFIVATPTDFAKKITVSKLKTFCENNKLEMLCIDGISYLQDERKQRGDRRDTSLTNISEDLMALSCELKIPIIVVTQSNREGCKEDDTPDLENIKDSDGIAYNASKVIAIRQIAGALEFGIKKNRDGQDGGKISYFWDIDKGEFTYVPSFEDANNSVKREEKVKEIKSAYKDATSVF